MTGRRSEAPRSFLRPGQPWPDGAFVDHAPAYAVKTAEVVGRLEAAMAVDARSARRLAQDADIDPGTLSRLRSGQAIPDLGTLVGLELALGRNLWCGPCSAGDSS